MKKGFKCAKRMREGTYTVHGLTEVCLHWGTGNDRLV
jgi:hypothetical protein